MNLSESRKRIIFYCCIVIVGSYQLINAGLNNIMYSLLGRMNAVEYYGVQSVVFTLCTSIMTLIGGKLGDLYGRRNVLFISSIILAIGVALMSPVANFGMFIAGRAISGLGVGSFISLPYAICAEVFDRDEYPKKTAGLQAALAASIVIGSTLAGILDNVGLTSVAIIYPCVLAFAAALLIFMNMPRIQSNKPVIDWAGITIMVVFMAALSLSLTFSRSMGLTNPLIIGGLVLAVVMAIVLYQVEKGKEQPLVPFYIFKNIKYTGVVLVTAGISIYNITMNLYVPLTGQQIMGLSSTVTGLFGLPRTILCIVLPAFAAIWVGKNAGRYRTSMTLCCITVIVCFMGFALVTPDTAAWLPFVLLGFTGIGEGFRSVSSYTLLVRQLDRKDMGIGIAMNSTVATFSATIGSTILNMIYTSMSGTNMTGALKTVHSVTAGVALVAALISIFLLNERKPAATA